jgi:hypothetical protein
VWASRFKTAPIAVGLVAAVMLATVGVGAANALTLDDTVTTDLVVTDTETSPEATVSEAPPAQEESLTEEFIAVFSDVNRVTTQSNSNDEPKKVFVCKYVGTPGVDETFSDIISVSDSTLKNDGWDGTFPATFPDEHGRSIAVVFDTGQPESDVVCPDPEGPPDPTCIDDPEWSYTFDPATGSGEVTVTGGEEGDELCAPLAVRAASWTYDPPASGSPSWPQTSNGWNDTLVNAIGVFSYGPPQLDDCRQYDIYASFGGFEELELPAYLNGSHDPFEPAFLHETLSGFGPNPTWSYTSSEGCDPPVVEEPEVAAYTDCEDTEGDNSFVTLTNPNDTPITVPVTIDGVTQDVIVPANDSVTVSFTLNEDEAVPVKVVFDEETIYEAVLLRDCEEEQTQVFGNPVVTATDVCVASGADVTYTLSFPEVELGENEFINPETLVYTDENGDLVEVEMNAGDPDQVITVHFAEDTDVTVEYGVLGQELTQLVVDTDCVTPPTGGLALTGDDLMTIMAWLAAALAAALAGIIMVVRAARKGKVVSAA